MRVCLIPEQCAGFFKASQCMDKDVEQDNERKRRCKEPELQDKAFEFNEHACGGSFLSLGFHCPPVVLAGQIDYHESKPVPLHAGELTGFSKFFTQIDRIFQNSNKKQYFRG